MTQQTDQAATQTGAVPARIQLDDFIEAVSRGVARALEAEDEVSGYVLGGPQPTRERPIVVMGIYLGNNPGGSPPPTYPRLPIREEK